MTGPWLHDRRATTLAEAIQLHGGDAADSAARFAAMDAQAQNKLVAYLENLVMYQSEEKH